MPRLPVVGHFGNNPSADTALILSPGRVAVESIDQMPHW